MLNSTDIANIRERLDPLGQLKIESLPTGAIRLRLISNEFVDLDEYERYGRVNIELRPIGFELGSIEIPSYILVTSDEAKVFSIDFPRPLPTWSEILSAPEPETITSLDDKEIKPFVATFYSFKGGVGRSTSLAIVSGLLAARGRRVVIIDFDLEAPGLTSIISGVGEDPGSCGVLDYIYQRWIQPTVSSPNLADCVRQVGSTANPIYLIPAGLFDQQYIHKLADFEIAKLYRSNPNLIRQLIAEAGERFSPDVILIDARTGFDDIGAATLLDLADLGIICFTPNRQSFLGLEWVTKAAQKQQATIGKPDLRFVLTPMPVTTTQDRQNRLLKTEEWISEHWTNNPGVLSEEMYTVIDYNPAIAIAEDLFNDLNESIMVAYKPIVDWIDSSLPDTSPDLATVQKPSQSVLNELSFQSITAEQVPPERIPQVFQRTSDFPKFIQDSISLIRGAKGTGKSLLFRLFVEQPQQACEVASVYKPLSHVEFIGAHGRRSLDRWIASSQVFATIEMQVGQDLWRIFWPVYALLRITKYLPNVRPLVEKQSKVAKSLLKILDGKEVSEDKFAQAIVTAIRNPELKMTINDLLNLVNFILNEQGKQAWLFYDELDAGFGHVPADYERRRRALEGLLAWWLEYGGQFTNIHLKCLLREDIWQELRFPNKSHYAGKDMSLQWQEDDLWKLVLRQAMESESFAREVAPLGIEKRSLEKLEVERLRKALIPLWGERMGPGNKAYTNRWVLRRITDGQGNRFPRSLIVLLSEAIDHEKKISLSTSKPILKPKSLIAAMNTVSENRVAQVKEEYPRLIPVLESLNNESSPIEKETLNRIVSNFDDNPEDIIAQMVNAGLLEKRKASDNESDRYAIAELYLLGLGMRRKGQR